MGFLQSLYDFFIELPIWVIRKIWEALVDSFIFFINVLPDPCCISETAHMLNWFYDSIIQNNNALFSWLFWLVDLIEIPFGLNVLFCALIARFILRRIPGIG